MLSLRRLPFLFLHRRETRPHQASNAPTKYRYKKRGSAESPTFVNLKSNTMKNTAAKVVLLPQSYTIKELQNMFQTHFIDVNQAKNEIIAKKLWIYQINDYLCKQRTNDYFRKQDSDIRMGVGILFSKIYV